MKDHPLIGPVAAPALHVMTFNVRRPITGPQRAVDRWMHRRHLVEDLLASERPTLLGTQEVVPEQATVIRDALGPTYRFVGRGHGPRERGEGCPLFFDTERLDLVDWYQTALSDRPDVPGSTSWGNRVPRILVTAEFRDRETAGRFVAINTHLDHLSPHSRIRSAEEIRAQVASAPHPAIVTGDFNTRVGSSAYRALMGGGVLTDAWDEASHRATTEWGTFGGYRAPRVGGRRIDWIAVSPEVAVDRVGINARTIDGWWPSDHLPVQAIVRVPSPS